MLDLQMIITSVVNISEVLFYFTPNLQFACHDLL